MSMSLLRQHDGPALSPISPKHELGAYEAMWLEQSASFRSIATRFAADPTAMPSDFVSPKIAEQCADEVFKRLKQKAFITSVYVYTTQEIILKNYAMPVTPSKCCTFRGHGN